MPRRKQSFSGAISNVDLRLMRVFKTVIDCGGLSAAQTELGVGRSTISRQVSDLETRLGLRLCNRGRKGIHLTQDGEKALQVMEEFLASADRFAANIANIGHHMVGKIDIGMIDYTVSDDQNPLIPAIQRFQDLAPEVSVNLMTGSPNEVERGVIDGSLHLGIVPDYQRHSGLEYIVLYEEPVGLYCGGDHPLAQAMRAGRLLTEAEVCQYKLVRRGYFESKRLLQRKQKFPVGSTVYQTESVLALVSSGAYLGFFPVHCQSLMRREYHELLPEAFRYSTSICAVYRSDRRYSHVLKEFLNLLCKTKT